MQALVRLKMLYTFKRLQVGPWPPPAYRWRWRKQRSCARVHDFVPCGLGELVHWCSPSCARVVHQDVQSIFMLHQPLHEIDTGLCIERQRRYGRNAAKDRTLSVTRSAGNAIHLPGPAALSRLATLCASCRQHRVAAELF